MKTSKTTSPAFRGGVAVIIDRLPAEGLSIVGGNKWTKPEEDKMEKQYMNIETGSVDDYDGWWYEDENGVEVNAVDRGEVVEVTQ